MEELKETIQVFKNRLFSLIDEIEDKNNENTIIYKFAINRKKKAFFNTGFVVIKSKITDKTHRQYLRETYAKIPYSFLAYRIEFEDGLELRDFFDFCKTNNIEIYELSEFTK